MAFENSFVTVKLIAAPPIRVFKPSTCLYMKPFRKIEGHLAVCIVLTVALGMGCCLIGAFDHRVYRCPNEILLRIWHPAWAWAVQACMLLLTLMLMNWQHPGLVCYCFRQVSVWMLLTFHAGACVFTIADHIIGSKMIYKYPALAVHSILVNLVFFSLLAYTTATLDAVICCVITKRCALAALGSLEVTYYATVRHFSLNQSTHRIFGLSAESASLYCSASTICIIVYMLLVSFAGRYFVVLHPVWEHGLETPSIEGAFLGDPTSTKSSTDDQTISDLISARGLEVYDNSIILVAAPATRVVNGPPMIDWRLHRWLFRRGWLAAIAVVCILLAAGTRHTPLFMDSHGKFHAMLTHVCQWLSVLFISIGNSCLMHRQNYELIRMCLSSARAQLLIVMHVAAGVAFLRSPMALAKSAPQCIGLLLSDFIFQLGLAYMWATVDSMQISKRGKIWIVACGVFYYLLEFLMVYQGYEIFGKRHWDPVEIEWWAYTTTPQNIMMACCANAGCVLTFVLGSLCVGRPYGVLHSSWELKRAQEVFQDRYRDGNDTVSS